ncbi:MAG: hypothetical protein J6N21_22950 [Butyrivibrio sp.]|nr:hypothetical protein [Butyrivibrio sp.]
MGRRDLEIKKIFLEEGNIPEIVRTKKLEAYDKIFEQVHGLGYSDGMDEGQMEACCDMEGAGGKNDNANRVHEKGRLQQFGNISKAAIFFLVCVIMMGSTAVAMTLILNRYDRMKQMDPNEKALIGADMEQGGDLAYMFSRELTDAERRRLDDLRTAYKNNEVFPERELARLPENEVYSGEEIALSRKADGEENMIYLPERELTDEELLEIIEYEEKLVYVIYENSEKTFAGSSDHAKRLAELTDDEVDYYYLALYSNHMEVSGGYCREVDGIFHGVMDNVNVLSKAEEKAYHEMEIQYEEYGRLPEGEAAVIDAPEQYAGEAVAVCRYDGNFYLPGRELTEEDLLQIIDFSKKAEYSSHRIEDEIRIGKRSERPGLPENGSEELLNLNKKVFAETETKEVPVELGSARVGDMVEFGSYEQDGDIADGAEKILWYVIDETQTSYTLLSVYILDAQPFHETQVPVTWEKSDIRKWLNGEFYGAAFSHKEGEKIIESNVENENGEDTKDKVYLLSNKEFCQYFGVDPETVDYGNLDTTQEVLAHCQEDLDTLDSRLYAKVTKRAEDDGGYVFGQKDADGYLKYHKLDFSKAIGNGSWWHRSVSREVSGAYATSDHAGVMESQYVDSGAIGVRPVIQVGK